MGLIRSFLGAVVFYTIIPVPTTWQPDFYRIARWIPLLGIFLGLLLSLADRGLTLAGMPAFTRAVVVLCLWVSITGGLHLDGVSDTADGLAVTDGEKRLQVMADSVTGAFGVMATVLLLLLKVSTLTDLQNNYFMICSALGWGRWGQVMAIALYPYLKPAGKGAFHKENLQTPGDYLLGLVILMLWTAALPNLHGLAVGAIGAGVALGVGYWFYRRLGGHTGDTYGAVVEWTEAISLCLFTLLG
ncbi:MAG: Adenosylcobinamide-GDP ribazoletransferase [Chroococcopsis gigantea SAG 12.99]|nr:Adenosylcobinamide-GDP ribazoletransferase [Chroococcopsis gigantea SAG 12.99]